jgi:hypothetical protein
MIDTLDISLQSNKLFLLISLDHTANSKKFLKVVSQRILKPSLVILTVLKENTKKKNHLNGMLPWNI